MACFSLLMFEITRGDVDRAFGSAVRNMERMHRDAEHSASGLIKWAGQRGAVAAGAALNGFAIGRLGPDRMNIMGTPAPADLVVSLVGYGLGLTDIYGRAAPYAYSFLDGIFAVYVGRTFMGVGQLSREKGLLGADPGPESLGQHEVPRGGLPQANTYAPDADSFTEAELAAMAAQ